MNPLQSDICVPCLPSTCVCEPGEEFVNCDECLVAHPEDMIRICGYCSQMLCDDCRDASGSCCGYLDE